MNEHVVNLSHEDCLRTTHDFGETVVRNICDGTSTTVPWGSLDWIGVLFLVALGLTFLVMFVAMAYMTITDR